MVASFIEPLHLLKAGLMPVFLFTEIQQLSATQRNVKMYNLQRN